MLHSRAAPDTEIELRVLRDDMAVELERARAEAPDENLREFPLFLPKAFDRKFPSLQPEHFRLTERQYRARALKAAVVRKTLRTRAKLLLDKVERLLPEEERGKSAFAERLKNGYYEQQPNLVPPPTRQECQEPTAPLARKRTKPRRLTLEERTDIVHRVLVQHEPVWSVAKSHRVTPGAVSQTVRRYKRQPDWLQTCREDRQRKRDKKLAMADHVYAAFQAGELLDSAKHVAALLTEGGFGEVKPHQARELLRDTLAFRFKYVRAANPAINCDRSLVLRQQFSDKLLHWLLVRPRLINIDESWLGMTDFRRTKWLPREVPRTAEKAFVSPRLSFIVALDSHGEVYWALNQANTDENVTRLFLRGLVTHLNRESRHWRKNTVIFVDGAGYHCSKRTLSLVKELDLPYAVSGPYSYETAPCELFFGAFKRADINPRKLGTGRK